MDCRLTDRPRRHYRADALLIDLNRYSSDLESYVITMIGLTDCLPQKIEIFLTGANIERAGRPIGESDESPPNWLLCHLLLSCSGILIEDNCAASP